MQLDLPKKHHSSTYITIDNYSIITRLLFDIYCLYIELCDGENMHEFYFLKQLKL